MKAFNTHLGLALPLARDNVDTDAIIPKQFLKSISKTGFASNLFHAWRYAADGSPNMDFVVNQARYKGASILVTGKNFGCGSSREHAPWALEQYGIRAVIAPSFADIFFNNCLKNGVLPIVLPEAEVSHLLEDIEATEGYQLVIDLPAQIVRKPNRNELNFEIEAFRKYCLIGGHDDIDLTLQQADEITSFEQKRLKLMPWLSQTLLADKAA